jgi:hypothetical protein
MPSDLDKIRQDRRKFLLTLYEATSSDQRRFVSLATMGQRLSIDVSDVIRIARFLHAEEFVTDGPSSESLMLTHKGILEAERLLDHQTNNSDRPAGATFPFVSDPRLRSAIERDYTELQRLDIKKSSTTLFFQLTATKSGTPAEPDLSLLTQQGKEQILGSIFELARIKPTIQITFDGGTVGATAASVLFKVALLGK